MSTNNGHTNPTFFSNNPKLAITDKQFYNFIMQPEISHLLYERYIIHHMDSLDENQKEELKEALGHIALFNIHTNCFPGFLRYVRKQNRKKVGYMKHIKELGILIAIDLLYGGKATLRRAKEKPSEDYEKSTLIYKRLSTRTRRRMFNQYPELLFKPLREVMDELENQTEQPFKTSFTQPPIGDLDPQYLASKPFPLDRYDIGFIQIQMMMTPIHSNYRMVEPYDTEELLQFHQYMKESILDLIQQFGEPPDQNQWIKHHLQEGTILTEHIYQTIMLAVIGRWFRKKKASARLRLLKEKHPLHYTRKDAHNAVKFTREWVHDKIALFDMLNRGINGFNQIQMFEHGSWIAEECLMQLELEPADQGLCYNNLAEQYRLMDKPRKYKINLLHALKVFEEISSDYDVAVTLGFLANAHNLLRENHLSRQRKEQATSLLDRIEDTDFRLSWGFIHLADSARWMNDLKWEIECLSKGFDHASEATDERFIDYINERLIAIHQGLNPFMLEKQGILKRPELVSWKKIGSSHHPVLPSKETQTA